jgi:hypothetical protein
MNNAKELAIFFTASTCTDGTKNMMIGFVLVPATLLPAFAQISFCDDRMLWGQCCEGE